MKMCQAITSLGHDVRLAVPAGREVNELKERSWAYLAHHYGLEKKFSIDWLAASPWMRSYDYAWRAVRWAKLGGPGVYPLPQAAALASICEFLRL
jgi:hypothetical protein